MKDDFSEKLERFAAALAEQNEAWLRAKAALATLDGESLVSVASDLFDELDHASSKASHGTAQVLSAFRA